MLWLEDPGCPLLDPGAISSLSPQRKGGQVGMEGAEEGWAREAWPTSPFCFQIPRSIDLKFRSDEESQVEGLQVN